MSLVKNAWIGFSLAKWSLSETVFYFLRGIARELKISPDFFQKIYVNERDRVFKQRYLRKKGSLSYFDFQGAKIPDVSQFEDKFRGLQMCFGDTFFFLCVCNDIYSKDNIEKYKVLLSGDGGDGPYGYHDGNFNVTVSEGDIVIDAGAWIGDFSAYAANSNAYTYAFEPVKDTYEWLCKTANLNKNIIPIKKGLGRINEKINISINGKESGSLGNSVVFEHETKGEEVEIITLDTFVKDNQLNRVDFIKADIEGAERDMLLGAKETLAKFAPKLALCTYHLPDDPVVLEKIILEANPKYKIIHLEHKLFAMVL